MTNLSNPVLKLALGTVQFGLPYGIANQYGQVPLIVAKAMLELAASKGIDTLDTAIAYGESETYLGKVGVHEFKLVTKLPAIPDSCKNITDWINEQFSGSLSRLGMSSVYGLLLHRSEQLLGLNGDLVYRTLQNLKVTGLVQKIGVSIYSPSELDALIPQYQLDLVQAPFNLMDQRLLKSGWLKRLKRDGTEIHTRSVFLQGLLLMSRSAIPSKFKPWTEVLNKWHDWLAEHSVTALQACLAYPLSFPEIDRVVVGADSKSQLEQIIEATQVSTAVSVDLPDLLCEDENLINPARWSQL